MSRYKSQFKAVLRILRSAAVGLGGARDDADADAPAADPQLSADVGYVVKTKLHSAISLQPLSPFLSRPPFLPESFRRHIQARTDSFVYNYANTGVHLNYGASPGKSMILTRRFLNLLGRLEMI